MFLKPKQEHQVDREFFTVYDSKTRSYNEPFPAENQDCVIRDFMNVFKREAKNPESQNRYYQNAEDFSIFKVGNFDLKTGALLSHQPEHVINLHDLRSLAGPTGGPRTVSEPAISTQALSST